MPNLVPIVEVVMAIGTSLVLWFGARMVLNGTLSAGVLIVFSLLRRQVVQAHAGTLEDDGRLLQGLGRIRAHS